MHLTELIDGSQPAHEGKNVDITGLTSNSRDVRPGYLFAALDGSRVRGADFIPEALRLGAVAVLAPPGTEIDSAPPGAATLITDKNPRRRFAKMAARFFGRQPCTIVAVTGTNGKTSTVSFLRELWRSDGRKATSLGGLGVEGDAPTSTAELTTPDPATLHHILATLTDAHISHCAIEASSHGLDQYRLDGVRVSACAFLNLTHDHLDYHYDLETYFTAKARLFAEVMQPGGDAVLNTDSPYSQRIAEICQARGHRVILFGQTEGDIRLIERSDEDFGQRIKIELLGQTYDLHIALPGAFQVDNLMAAAGLAMATGMSADAIAAGLPQLTGVRGRLELVTHLDNGAPVYIDYAHTPDALSAALSALRPHAQGRLIVLFGCGGDRDSGKRPLMGQIATDLADVVFISDDNPRYEDAASIRSEIVAASPGAIEIAGRGDAILAAIAELRPEDLLLIAGKGHEQGQSIAERVIPFDDGETARRAVMAQSRGGAEMPS